MKLIFAPDSFKESLTALEICEILERVTARHFPDAETICIPVADGGEGTVDARQNVKTCPKCEMTMVKRKGKFGEFWGCKGFPDCRYTENI